MSVELWKAIFDWAAVLLVGLTFIAGAGALITGRILSDRQQERVAKAEGVIADAGRRAAEADAKAEGFKADSTLSNSVRIEVGRKPQRQMIRIEIRTLPIVATIVHNHSGNTSSFYFFFAVDCAHKKKTRHSSARTHTPGQLLSGEQDWKIGLAGKLGKSPAIVDASSPGYPRCHSSAGVA